ncbi:hypothetical protein BD779DRAFT_1476607 [Infundibulicybe gibba]|nr:hypothetical protein BD779DRAFT_1476607 [Infundibulicybe gibba]
MSCWKRVNIAQVGHTVFGLNFPACMNGMKLGALLKSSSAILKTAGWELWSSGGVIVWEWNKRHARIRTAMVVLSQIDPAPFFTLSRDNRVQYSTEHFWKPSDAEPPERLYESELYSSNSFLAEHEKVCALPPEPGCTLERVVAGIMLWSDSTHLTNFGNAALWPIYLFLGNQSKYTRAKPTSFAAHHLAYIPKLSDAIQDVYRKVFGKVATAAVLTHCKRELMQVIWLLLLDEEFMHAYIHGFVIEFADGVSRRVFPRFFTYSADYPEKILLACIKYLGKCPCPRCLIKKANIGGLGGKRDQLCRTKNARLDTPHRRSLIETARHWIYETGTNIAGTAMERLLGPHSLVPTRNAFSTRLQEFGFNFYNMFVPDLLHEFELGVWKAVFTHLLRVLYAYVMPLRLIQPLRYRNTPTFGRDTIRKFHNNASGMKKLAARDFEDLLQCALPVFENLLPAPFDTVVLNLLFELATWHAFAKLRLHTETTLDSLDNSTTRLGSALHQFHKKVCLKFETFDLPSEEAARGRRKAAMATKARKEKASGPADTTGTTKPGSTRKRRYFNFFTYKLHALGDYVRSIRTYGTSDSYSTQTGELEHRRVKKFYPRSQKSQFTRGIAKLQRREQILHRMKQKIQRDEKMGPNSDKSTPSLRFEDEEGLPFTSPEAHYHISKDVRHKVDITRWLGSNADDPALTNFLQHLKNHLLNRLLDREYDGDEDDYTSAERNTITFVGNRLYRHKVLRVNYTTYDLRRAQDSLNTRNHGDIMVLSREDGDTDGNKPHPYWYARIVGIFHAMVRHSGPLSCSSEPQHMEFLWVRWFGRDLTHKSGWKARRLHRVGFIDSNEDPEGAFGFLDPNEVIRGVHLIPAFAHGRTTSLLAPSIIRPPREKNKDWLYYYVGMFADRDMVMRFRGGGVGHTSTRTASNFFLDDHDALDIASRERRREAAHQRTKNSQVVESEDTDLDEQDESDWDSQPEDNDDQDCGGQDDSIDEEVQDYGYNTGNDSDDTHESDDNDDVGVEGSGWLDVEDDDALGAEDGEALDDEEGLEGNVDRVQAAKKLGIGLASLPTAGMAYTCFCKTFLTMLPNTSAGCTLYTSMVAENAAGPTEESSTIPRPTSLLLGSVGSVAPDGYVINVWRLDQCSRASPMDVFGTVASAIGLVTKLVGYLQAVKGAKEDRLKLLLEVSALKTLLEVMRGRLGTTSADGSGGDISNTVVRVGIESSLDMCHGALQSAINRLENLVLSLPNIGQPSSFAERMKDLKWPFHQGEVKTLLESIERLKFLLSLALQASLMEFVETTCDELLAAGKNVENIKAAILSIEANQNGVWTEIATVLNLTPASSHKKN